MKFKNIIIGISAFLIISILGYIGYFRFFTGDDAEKLPRNSKNVASEPADLPVTQNGGNTYEFDIPERKVLENDYHIFQTFNNCGPASLSMALSYYGIAVSQKELGDEIRPYQIASGDNDDKSVTLEELAEKAKEYDLVPYHRPAGDPEIVKKFIYLNIPVITRTWTKPDEDIGHYRVIKGYDEVTREFIQDDSLQGKNLRYKFDYFNSMWDKFSYEFLVLVPKAKTAQAEMILGELLDEKTAWERASIIAKEQLKKDPDDANSRLNLSVAYHNLRNYQGSVAEFEKAENSLPKRALWYQIEPILSYYELGNYDRVFEITDRILNNGNRAYSEAYIIRGDIYKSRGQTDLAREEYEKAVQYNVNLDGARERLNSL